jgi:hypothetical protein
MSKSQASFTRPTPTKKADTYGSLIFLPEEVGDLFVGDRTAETLASRPVRGPLKRLTDSVNRLFAILFHFFVRRAETG